MKLLDKAIMFFIRKYLKHKKDIENKGQLLYTDIDYEAREYDKRKKEIFTNYRKLIRCPECGDDKYYHNYSDDVKVIDTSNNFFIYECHCSKCHTTWKFKTKYCKDLSVYIIYKHRIGQFFLNDDCKQNKNCHGNCKFCYCFNFITDLDELKNKLKPICIEFNDILKK